MVQALKTVVNQGDDVVKRVGAFIKKYSSSRHADTLSHKIDDIAVHMTRNPVVNKKGVLTHGRAAIAQVTEEEFARIAKSQLVKSGTGDATKIIDEFTGSTYYLTETGPAFRNDSEYGNIPEELWNKLLAIFT